LLIDSGLLTQGLGSHELYMARPSTGGTCAVLQRGRRLRKAVLSLISARNADEKQDSHRDRRCRDLPHAEA
jgi:hypothetical protein